MGAISLAAVGLRAVSSRLAGQKEDKTMKHNGLRNWTKRTFLAGTETIWAIMAGFVASVLATPIREYLLAFRSVAEA